MNMHSERIGSTALFSPKKQQLCEVIPKLQIDKNQSEAFGLESTKLQSNLRLGDRWDEIDISSGDSDKDNIGEMSPAKITLEPQSRETTGKEGDLPASSRESDDSEIVEIPKKKLREMARMIAQIRNGNDKQTEGTILDLVSDEVDSMISSCNYQISTGRAKTDKQSLGKRQMIKIESQREQSEYANKKKSSQATSLFTTSPFQDKITIENEQGPEERKYSCLLDAVNDLDYLLNDDQIELPGSLKPKKQKEEVKVPIQQEEEQIKEVSTDTAFLDQKSPEELASLMNDIKSRLGIQEIGVPSASQLKTTKQSSSVMERANQVRMMMLHASPNTMKEYDNGRKKYNTVVPPALDFKKEQTVIKDTFVSTGRKIIFSASMATKVAFQKTVYEAPQILHISCHGVAHQGKQYLLLENEYGGGDMVSKAELEKLVASAENKIKLVFIAACDSEQIGELFKQYGVEHVICIKDKRYVLDDVAIKFTKTFYTAIFNGQPVCKAFKNALPATTFNIGGKQSEVSLFTLLRASDYVDVFDTNSFGVQEHVCQPIRSEVKGQWECVSEHNIVKMIPSRLHLKFREMETSQILHSLLIEKQRFLSLSGLQGIGKSSLAREALHYAAERKMFLGGTLFIQCKEIRSLYNLLKMILRQIFKLVDLGAHDKRQFFECILSADQLMDYLKDFFNGRASVPLRKRNKRGEEHCQTQLFLLCLDNVEAMVQNDEHDDFMEFLGQLYDECPHLCLLVTTTVSLGAMPNQIVPEVQYVEQLKHQCSAQLFFDRCGPFGMSDLVDWIFCDKSYPYEKLLLLTKDSGLLKRLQENKGAENEPLKQELMQKIEKHGNGCYAGQVEWMSHHDMFRQMAGNPTSITMISAACNNQNLDLGDNSLIYMYERIVGGKDIIIDEIGMADEFNTKGKKSKNRVRNQMISLENTTRMSLNLLQQSSKDDTEVLNFLAFLPGGITQENLETILNKKSVQKSLQKLESLSFLEAGYQKYTLTPYMINFINSRFHQTPARKFVYMDTICNFYSKILRENYVQIARGDADLNKIFAPQQTKLGEKSISIEEESKKYSRQSFALTKGDTTEYTVFEMMMSEMGNIMGCLRFLIEYASSQAGAKVSMISVNKSYTMVEKNEKEKVLMPKRRKSIANADAIQKFKEKMKANLFPDIREASESGSSSDDDDGRKSNSSNKPLVNKLEESKSEVAAVQKQEQSPATKGLDTTKLANIFNIAGKTSLNRPIKPEARMSLNNDAFNGRLNLGDGQRKMSDSSSTSESEWWSEMSSDSEKDDHWDGKTMQEVNKQENIGSGATSPAKGPSLFGQLQMKDQFKQIGQAFNRTKSFVDKKKAKQAHISSKLKTALQLRMLISQKNQTKMNEEESKASQKTSAPLIPIVNPQQILQKRMTMQNNQQSENIWKPMNNSGEFIILLIANMFLAFDYEGCLQIAQNDFSFMDNSCLFESNLLRFLALASCKAFEHAILADDSDEAFYDNFGLLIQAINKLQNALSIYSTSNSDTKDIGQNWHGIAVTNYTLGVIYYNCAQLLADQRVQDHPQFQSYRLENEEQYKRKAQHFYQIAATNFEKVNHIIGHLLSLKGMMASLGHKGMTVKKRLDLVTEKLRQYQQDVGFENCYFILRESGPEISVMAEIIFTCNAKDLFSADSKSHLQKKDANLMQIASNSRRYFADGVVGQLTNMFTKN